MLSYKIEIAFLLRKIFIKGIIGIKDFIISKS